MKPKNNKLMRTLAALGLPGVVLALASTALAGNGNGAGYLVLQTSACNLSAANPVCTMRFDLPSKAILSSGNDVLRFVVDGGSLNFEVHVNGHNISHYTNCCDFVGTWQPFAASDLQLNNNVAEFIYTAGDSANIEDVVLDFRLSSVP